MPEEKDDRELVEQAAGGDVAAFESLVRRHTDAAWRMARSMLRDDFAAEEAVQDTFLKAYRNLHTFRGDAKVGTWIFSICHRTCIDHLRRRRHDVVPLEEARWERGSQGRHEDPTDLRVAVEEALARLPAEEREAFVLVEVVGHSREEAAEIAGVPASTMRSRVSRARRKLARTLGHARTGATETTGETTEATEE